MGAYIPPDSVVDTSRPEFEFLGKHNRIRAIRLRGELSFGMLVPLPSGRDFAVGQDVAELFGVTHYQPPEDSYSGTVRERTQGVQYPPPLVYVPVYDMENLRRYPGIFNDGEPVLVTEKIHGANGRWVYDGGKLHVGSHKQWKAHDGSNIWSRVAKEHPELETFCKTFPGTVVFGEVYGWVQDLHYGRGPSEIDYAVFDLLYQGRFLDALHGREQAIGFGLKVVPRVLVDAFSTDLTTLLADGPSLVDRANHNREGVVIKPLTERTSVEIGRVQLKLVGEWYLTRKE